MASVAQAALGVNARWVKQLKRKVRERGDFAVVHGNSERLWQTLQSRLVQFFVMRGIKDIAGANAVLPEFIKEFNAKFHKEAENKTETAFAPLQGMTLTRC